MAKFKNTSEETIRVVGPNGFVSIFKAGEEKEVPEYAVEACKSAVLADADKADKEVEELKAQLAAAQAELKAATEAKSPAKTTATKAAK